LIGGSAFRRQAKRRSAGMGNAVAGRFLFAVTSNTRNTGREFQKSSAGHFRFFVPTRNTLLQAAGQKRRVFAKVRDSRPKTRNSTERPRPLPRPSHRRRCRGKAQTPCGNEDAQLPTPKNVAFLRRCATRQRGRGRFRERATTDVGGNAYTPCASEDAQLPTLKNAAFLRRCATRARRRASRHGPLATDHGPLTTDQISKDPCVRLSESRHLPALFRSTARLAREVRVQNHPIGLRACQNVRAAARPRRWPRRPAMMPNCLPLPFRRSGPPKSSQSSAAAHAWPAIRPFFSRLPVIRNGAAQNSTAASRILIFPLKAAPG